MKFVIDTRNGIAGDIVNAGLIGLGADKTRMISSMEYAGNQIGKTKIDINIAQGTIKLEMKMEPDSEHLHEFRAKHLLAELIGNLKINKFYKDIAIRTLQVLCDAERYVHIHDRRLQYMTHTHNSNDTEAILHEAKDILIDIVGLCIGLQELEISEIFYLDYINVGNNTIRFSHGEFDVPAPATEYILNKYDFDWQKSHISGEMATPTGVSVLAGCQARRVEDLKDFRIMRQNFAEGTRGLPAISFLLAE